MEFSYVAYTSQRGLQKGKVEAPDREGALAAIALQGLKVIKVSAARQTPGLELLFPSLFKAGGKDLVQFARQVASMLVSGGTLVRALELAEQEAKNRVMRRVLTSLKNSLINGSSLTDAMKEHPKVFNPLFLSVVEVGEHTGRIGPSLEQLADMIEHDAEAKSKAVKAMMYPMAIMGMSLVTLGVLITFAVPPLLKVFEQMGADVPAMTKFAVAMVNFITGEFMSIMMVLGVIGVAAAILRRFPTTQRYVDTIMVKLPLIGVLVVASELARISRTLSILLTAGVSLSDALRMAIQGCSNSRIKDALVAGEASLYAGHGLTEELRNQKVLPTFFVELVMMGEEGNQLPRMMSDAAVTYQKEKDARLGAVLSTLEPLSTLVVGGIVGFIAFAMFVPIYSGLGALSGG